LGKIFPGVAVSYHLEGFSRFGKWEDGFYDRMNRIGPYEFGYFGKLGRIGFHP